MPDYDYALTEEDRQLLAKGIDLCKCRHRCVCGGCEPVEVEP